MKAVELYEAAKNSVVCQNGGNGTRLELKLLLADYNTKMEQYREVMLAVEKLCSRGWRYSAFPVSKAGSKAGGACIEGEQLRSMQGTDNDK